jgi:hypothetical protein
MTNGDFELFQYSLTQAFRVSKTALKDGDAFVRLRIAGYLRIHPEAVEVPDYQFARHLFQPEG